jgi:hypothetical protein
MIIGFAGAAYCGKATAAAYLAERLGYIERRIEGDLKDVPDPLLGGRTPREGMVGIGYDWGRERMHPLIWTNAWRNSAQAALAIGVLGVLAEDVRDPKEVSETPVTSH